MAKTPPVPDALWPLVSKAMGMHAHVYRATRGVVGAHIPGVGPMLLLDHVGAKSGVRRTSPLLYLRDGDAYVIVASKGGNARHPAWFHNLRANPATMIQVGRRKIPVRARVATPQERERLNALMQAGWNRQQVAANPVESGL